MVKISWILTDKINDDDLEGFDKQWNGIYGYFQISVNNQKIGFCPDRKLYADEESYEDILYWLTQLSYGILQVKYSQEYEIQLLSMNREKIILRQKDKLIFILANSETNEEIWFEKIDTQELCNELVNNIVKFICEIRKQSSLLLQSRSLRRLMKAQNMLEAYLKY